MRYKLGAVPYLNALPLIHYLEERPLLAPPAELARLLKSGKIDIATAPVVTLFENPNYSLIPGICIGSNGPVWSVKLFFESSNLSLKNVQSIELDEESRTSVMLLKVLLKFKYGRDLGEIELRGGERKEGALLIGDKAMEEETKSITVDLAEEWTDWTGLPFVFAAWVSRLPEVSDETIQKLTKARDKSIENLNSLVPENHHFSKPFVKKYLKNLVYEIGPKEMEGMALFREYLIKGKLL